MLSRVKIQNFKSIGEPGVDLELKPLTFLVGPNGGGKSSILEAIILASTEGTAKTGFISFSDLMEFHFREESNNLNVEVEVSDPISGESASYEYADPPLISSEPTRKIRFNDERNKTDTRNLLREIFFGNVFPIKATRGRIEDRKHPGEPTWVGAEGEHTLDILERIPQAQYRTQRGKIQKWGSIFGVSHVAASHITRSEIEGNYEDNDLKFILNLSVTSSGSKQILPIIVELFWAESESIILIEEPEISLHPQAQIDVMEMFAEAIKEDKQIIATTHGLFMIQAIGYAVQKGWLEREQIAVYHIEKKKDTGTIAKQLPLNDRGYIKGWIPSFTRVERKLVRELLKTLPEE